MGFRAIQYRVATQMRATRFLRQSGYSTKETQKILDKGRMRQNGRVIRKGDILAEGVVEILGFVPDDIGLRPFFARLSRHANYAFLQQEIEGMEIEIASKPPYFCVFNKPTKLLTHPKNLAQRQSLLDSARYYFGTQCNPCHRLDYETSGLLVCSLDKESEVMLKNCFLNRGVQKSYLAIIEGICTDSLFIESDIIFAKDFGNLCIQGKSIGTKIQSLTKKELQTFMDNWEDRGRAATLLTPLRHFHDNAALLDYLRSEPNPFFPNQSFGAYHESYSQIQTDSKIMQQYYAFLHSLIDKPQSDFDSVELSDPSYMQQTKLMPQGQYTLLRLMPLSGKTHQLRIHTQSINHRILGDTLYGLHPVVASFFLDSQSPKNAHTLCEYRTSFSPHPTLHCPLIQESCFQESYFKDSCLNAHQHANTSTHHIQDHTTQRSTSQYATYQHFVCQKKQDNSMQYSFICQKIAPLFPLDTAPNLAQRLFSHHVALQYRHGSWDTYTPQHRFLSPIASLSCVSCYFWQANSHATPPYLYMPPLTSLYFAPPHAIAPLSYSSHIATMPTLSHSIESDCIASSFAKSLFMPPCSLTPYYAKCHTTPHSYMPQDKEFEDIFFTFLYFFYALPTQQAAILHAMRMYYCKIERLALHADTLEFLDFRFWS